MVPYSMARSSITKAMQRRLMIKLSYTSRDMRNENGILDETRQEVYVENIEAHYEDIESLNKLLCIRLRCQKHVNNCALKNVFKLFNWWHYHHHE